MYGSSECRHHSGSPATSLLKYLIEEKIPWKEPSPGNANAVIDPPGSAVDDREATTYFDLQPGDRVVMVGLFSPLVERIRSTGAALTIIENNPARMKLPNEKEKEKALKNCDVAIINGNGPA
jgi:uncharacterized protein (DUF4213/DUF364 family)